MSKRRLVNKQQQGGNGLCFGAKARHSGGFADGISIVTGCDQRRPR